MAEFIEREALIEHMKDLPTWWADSGGVYGQAMKYPEGMFDCDDVINSVDNAPAADVVEVVRCKDCRYSSLYLNYFYCENDEAPWAKNTMANLRDANDFCSYGERRKEDG